MGKSISYSPLKMVVKYARYLLNAGSRKGHGIHSPFVFDFIVHILNDKKTHPPIELEECRKQLLKDETVLQLTDFGAGAVSTYKEKSVRDIAKTSLKSMKYARLLFRIVKYYKAKTVLELGTSLGITTAHLASNANVTVYTLEGDRAVANIAERNFHSLDLKNIKLVPGNFDETLLPLLEIIEQPDIVFIDGNHRQEPTIRYFNQIKAVSGSNIIIILDDIHWSQEMEQAWEEIKNDPDVLLTIDLFFIGIVLFRKEFKVKQHYCIRF